MADTLKKHATDMRSYIKMVFGVDMDTASLTHDALLLQRGDEELILRTTEDGGLEFCVLSNGRIVIQLRVGKQVIREKKKKKRVVPLSPASKCTSASASSSKPALVPVPVPDPLPESTPQPALVVSPKSPRVAKPVETLYVPSLDTELPIMAHRLPGKHYDCNKSKTHLVCHTAFDASGKLQTIRTLCGHGNRQFLTESDRDCLVLFELIKNKLVAIRNLVTCVPCRKSWERHTLKPLARLTEDGTPGPTDSWILEWRNPPAQLFSMRYRTKANKPSASHILRWIAFGKKAGEFRPRNLHAIMKHAVSATAVCGAAWQETDHGKKGGLALKSIPRTDVEKRRRLVGCSRCEALAHERGLFTASGIQEDS